MEPTAATEASRSTDMEVDLFYELELLEERIQEAARRIEVLLSENARLMTEVEESRRHGEELERTLATLREREGDRGAQIRRLEEERAETVRRLSRLVERVDSLGVGH